MCVCACVYMQVHICIQLKINKKAAMNLKESGKVQYMGVLKREEWEESNLVTKSQSHK